MSFYKIIVLILFLFITLLYANESTDFFQKYLLINCDNNKTHNFFPIVAFVSLIIILLLLHKEKTLKKYNDRLNSLLLDLEEKNTQLKKLSITDKLTNIYNRTKLDNILKANLKLFQRYKNDFSVIILDIDNFKNVNDTYGHLVGDEVLQEFAKILRQNIRETDLVGRWGGEEFMIISPETNLEGTCVLANTIREKINNHNFKEVGHITASFGVSCIKSEDNEINLVKRADERLYKAKDLGKNRVEC